MQLKDPKLFREQCYINGAWVSAASESRLAVHNPADGAVVGHVPDMGAQEARRAIAAADEAWPAWRMKSAKERSTILRRWFELLLENQEDLARIMTIEQGKPLAADTHAPLI